MKVWDVKLKVTDDGIDDAGKGNEYLPEQDIKQMITSNALPMAGLKVEVVEIKEK